MQEVGYGIQNVGYGMQAVGCRMHIHVCLGKTAALPSGKHSRIASVLRSRGDQIPPANALCCPRYLGSAVFLGVTIPNSCKSRCSPLHPPSSVSLLSKLPIKSSAQCLITHTTKPKGCLGFHPSPILPFPWMRVEGKQREHLPTPTRLFIHGKGRGWSVASAQPWQLAAPWEL